MPNAVCKFRVESVVQSQYNQGEETIVMCPSYDPDDPEDTKFSRATPWGQLEFGLSNPNLLGLFKVGQMYHLHLIPIEDDPSRGRFIS